MNYATPQRGLLRLATGRPCRFKAGRDHSSDVTRTPGHSVTRPTLGGLTHDDARLLGHKGTAALKRSWVAQRDASWLAAGERSDADVLQRFAARWAHRGVWLVRYRAAEEPRFMAAGRGTVSADGNGDYTATPTRSIDPDAECVDRATQDRYAKDALAFCIGRQIARAKQAQAEKAERGRSMRRAA